MRSKSYKYTYEPFHRWWRPAMAWAYLAICLFDFVIGPATYYYWFKGVTPVIQWVPLTLQGGGLFHLAMGAIVGFTVYGRTLEKLKDKDFEMETSTETGPMPVAPPTPPTPPMEKPPK